MPFRLGAGKGTYSTRVAQHLGLTPIAAGDLVREVIVSGSDRGRKVRWRRDACREPVAPAGRKEGAAPPSDFWSERL